MSYYENFFKDLENILTKEYGEKLYFYKNDRYYGIKTHHKNVYSLIDFVSNHKNLLFKQLIDITAIDYPSRESRFDVIYLLLSLTLNKRILIKSSLKEEELIDSITSIFKSANWCERECYDLFGIRFNKHPDLRRIMTDYNFEGHPLRKDFPLTGHTEVRYDILEKKVLYEPVKLSQEYRDFDYSSPWEGLPNKLIGDEKAEKKKENEKN